MATKIDPWSNITKKTDEVIKLISDTTTPPKFPNELSIEGKEFLKVCLKKDPEKRLTAKELLKHQWLTTEQRSSKGEIKEHYSSLRKDSKDKNEFNIKKDHGYVQIKIKNNVNEKKNLLNNILNEEDRFGEFSISIDESSSSKSDSIKSYKSDHNISNKEIDNKVKTEVTLNSNFSKNKQDISNFKDKIVSKQTNGNSLINNKTKITVFNNEEESFIESEDDYDNRSHNKIPNTKIIKNNNNIEKRLVSNKLENNQVNSQEKSKEKSILIKQSIEDDIEFSNI